MRHFYQLFPISAILVCSCVPSLEAEWYEGEADISGRSEHTLVIKDFEEFVGEESDWSLYFSQMPEDIRILSPETVRGGWVMGCHFEFRPSETFIPDGNLVIKYMSRTLPRRSWMPEGMTLRIGDRRYRVDLIGYFQPIPFQPEVYGQNQHIRLSRSEPYDIIPEMKKVCPLGGFTEMGRRTVVIADEEFRKSTSYLKRQLAAYRWKRASDVKVIIEKSEGFPEGGYSLEVNGDIRISASDTDGVWNGTVSLVNVISNCGNGIIPNFKAVDSPDFQYRGAMLDVARMFTAKEDLFKLLDMLARYKVNVFQFHFSDDEAWRLEIPGLPELTSVGCTHGIGDETVALVPSYDGCTDPKDKSAPSYGYFSEEDFVEILEYADDLNIKVIPEIESPGHSRAAIKSMEAYCRRTGDRSFLLSEKEDSSVYMSAQWYTDNAMNVALESTYNFMGYVIDRIALMYRKAGLVLDEIHIGGDEVRSTVWMHSPVCLELLGHLGKDTNSALMDYYASRMLEICESRNLKMHVWQEIAMDLDEGTKGDFQKNGGHLNCWDTLPEEEKDDIPYRLADDGYNVILSNVDYTYLDQVYSLHPEEKGHDWGGAVDEKVTFSMLPYRPGRKGKENIIGIQAQLFTETIRSFDDVTYHFFPKSLGIFERAWNSTPSWCDGGDEAFDRAYCDFLSRIVSNEYPYWSAADIDFHIPQPGLMLKDSILLANSYVPGIEIRYTTDGTDPGRLSPLWSGPVPVDGNREIRARAFYGDRKSVTTVIGCGQRM